MREDQRGDDGHPEQAHHADREQHEHQSPAAADAIRAVLDPHADRAADAVPPAAEDEMHRRAAVAQAHLLQRRQLVKARQRDKCAGYVWTAAAPVQEPDVERPHAAVEGVREEAVDRPGGEVRKREDPRRDVRQSAARLLRRDAVKEQNHRRNRRQHHRRHHRHPDPDVPAEPAEIGAGAHVHSGHPVDGDDPGDERTAKKQGGLLHESCRAALGFCGPVRTHAGVVRDPTISVIVSVRRRFDGVRQISIAARSSIAGTITTAGVPAQRRPYTPTIASLRRKRAR